VKPWSRLALGILGSAALLSSAFAQQTPALKLIRLDLQAREIIAQSGLPDYAWGVVVLPIPSDEKMPAQLRGSALNAQLPMNPASIMKLVTTRAALGLLGPEFRHRTRIATTGRLEGEVLKGDLFFQGGGDPKLVTEDLAAIARQLRQIGIQRIEGDLVIDGSRFAEPEVDPGQFDGKPFSAYNVGPHAAMVNFKAMKVSVWPLASGKVSVATEPRIPQAEILTRVKLVSGGCKATNVQARMDEKSRLVVSGSMGRRCNGTDFYVAVLDHARFSFNAFKSAWEDAGGSIKSRPVVGTTPVSARILVDWQSPRPLIELVSDINKMSNNPMTRNLFLNLSAERGMIATREASAQLVKDYLRSKGLDFPELVLDNGSGLSRQERISPENMARLLVQGLFAQDAGAWIQTLPVVGNEGTVRHRFRQSELQGRAWLKTGALEDVRGLAGYLLSASGKWVVLVLLVNHPEAAKARSALDSLVKWAHTNH
jgi:serine-type D-Ala-D-Ala carboxypeptidase/endopeptidase (penicillin-binding protein 4)